MKKNNSKNFIVYVLSFIIPIIITFGAYFALEIYPGGSGILLLYDMKSQLLALYGYLSNGGNGFDSIFHNMSGGLGGGFFGTFALYLSPFDLVYTLVPTQYLPDAIYAMTLLRIGFSGLFCSVFIKKSNIEKASDSNALCVTLSCCYALMSYVFMYAMSPMWLDFVMLLPLLALSCEKIVDGKFGTSFVLLLSFCIISDYYIAYMVVIAITMYFVYRLIEGGNDFKQCLKRFYIFALSGILSAGLAALLILPVLLDFQRGKFSEDNSGQSRILFKNSLFDVLGAFKPSSYSTLDYYASPNIFCGSIVLILVLIWLLLGKKHIKERIASFLILVIYFLSFIIAPLDRIWHGFRDPVGFPVRYAFTFVFFMICFALRGYRTLAGFERKEYKSLFSLIFTLFIGYTYIEMYINGSYILSRLAIEDRFSNRDEYVRTVDSVETVLDYEREINTFDYSRTSKNFNYSRFDGALFGYDGIERFSSSYNYALSEFLKDIGFGTSRHTISDRGITPPVASLLDVGYFMSWHNDISDYYDYAGEYRGYGLYINNNRLPLMFATGIENPDDYDEFGEIPFDNINTVFSDITGIDDVRIFDRQDYTEVFRDPADYYEDNTLGFADYVLSPEEDGYYWFYSEYVYPDESRYKTNPKNGEFNTVYPYAEYFINGLKIGTYRNDEFSYCNDLGLFNAGENYLVSLDASIAEIGTTHFYKYNKEFAESVLTDLRYGGFTVNSINRSGITASGYVDEDSYILVTLPYEDGYRIYIDGNKTDYTSYRNSLMLVRVPQGQHEVVIKYIPPGFTLGLTISILSLLILIVIVLKNKKKIHD